MYKCHFLNTYPTSTIDLPYTFRLNKDIHPSSWSYINHASFSSIDTFTLHIVSLNFLGSSPFVPVCPKRNGNFGSGCVWLLQWGTLPQLGKHAGNKLRDEWMGFSVGFLVATWIFCGEFCFVHEFSRVWVLGFQEFFVDTSGDILRLPDSKVKV